MDIRNPSMPTIFAVLILFLGISCQQSKREVIRSEKYANGNIRAEQVRVQGDSFRAKIIYYFPSGQIEDKYFVINDTIKDGIAMSYYANGKIKSEGNWKIGFKTGNFNYYDSLGNLTKIVSFIRFRDTSVSRANQVYFFNKNRQIIKQSPSLYYEINNLRDTILFGEKMQFSIKLIGSRFPNVYLQICDFDEHFIMNSTESCDTFHLLEDNSTTLIKDKYIKGRNIIRGSFVNYIEVGSQNRKSIEVFFADTFFVK